MITTPYQIYKIVRETTHHDISFHYYAKYFYCVHFLVNLCRFNKFMKISKYCNLLILDLTLIYISSVSSIPEISDLQNSHILLLL